ncbi:MAG: Rieske 2Fe-2S domain-containing protein [Polyangiaceae bacterium]|jgi:nitrite reductase (NADH) small subunit
MTRHVSLGSVSRIPPGEGRSFEVGNVRVAVFHGRDGRVFATQAECPHRQGPLADGLLGGTTLVCPLHEWTFDLMSGMALQGGSGIRVYPVHVDAAGNLVIQVDDDGGPPPWRITDYVKHGSSE